jgi:hypothetical protein
MKIFCNVRKEKMTRRRSGGSKVKRDISMTSRAREGWTAGAYLNFLALILLNTAFPVLVWPMNREELDQIDARERYLDLKQQLDEFDAHYDGDGDGDSGHCNQPPSPYSVCISSHL